MNEAKCLNGTFLNFHPLQMLFASKRSGIAHKNKLYQCRGVSLRAHRVFSYFISKREHFKFHSVHGSFHTDFVRCRSKKFYEIEWIWYPPACGAYKVLSKLNELNIIHSTMQCLNNFETGRVYHAKNKFPWTWLNGRKYCTVCCTPCIPLAFISIELNKQPKNITPKSLPMILFVPGT